MRKAITILVFLSAMLLAGCAASGNIIDHAKVNLPIDDMHLVDYPAFKVSCNGAMSEIRLQSISSLRLDSRTTKTIDGELYYGAEIVLQSGIRLSSGTQSHCYVSVQNTLAGKLNSGDKYSSTLDNIVQIKVKQ